MNSKTGYGLFVVTNYGSSFRPVYVFPAREEAYEAKEKLQKLCDMYNKKLIESGASKDTVMLSSRVLNVQKIQYFEGITTFDAERKMWRQETVYGLFYNTDEVTIYTDKEACQDKRNFMMKKGYHDYHCYELSITEEQARLKKLIDELIVADRMKNLNTNTKEDIL